MSSNQELHERFLYPVTRIRVGNVGGSGVLVYSQPDPKKEGQHLNMVLTCEHVVSAAIKVRDEWNSVLKRQVKTDYFDKVQVELFDYDGSEVISSNASSAVVVAYDKRHDIALLKLDNPRHMPHVATLYPEDGIDNLRRFDKVWVSGCSLLHDPFASSGELTYLRENIEEKDYLMANAPSVFGNSGGALFHDETMSLLGLTSRVTVTGGLGFGGDIMVWMQFSTHPERMYEFFQEQELQYLYDEGDNYYASLERREAKRKESLRDVMFSQASDSVQTDNGDG